MNQDSTDRIRSATFTVVRRGYDQREVEQYLSKLADWLETGGGDQARSETVKRELERVGERTAKILAAAEDSARQTRSEADADARERVEKSRARADEIRTKAEREAAERIAAAEAKAARIVEEGTKRRQDIEAVISDLVAKRDSVLADARRLAGELGDTVSAHEPGDADRFAHPGELDPAERDGAPARRRAAKARADGS